MVFISGGEFRMGTIDGMSYEGPEHSVYLGPFWIDKHEVTVAQFEEFVSSSGYVTDAERFGWSGIFDKTSGRWLRGDRATWLNPDGTGVRPSPDEPVTQVSWNDATAYASWAGKRLPSEAEWEYAARGGLESKTYSWGNDLRPGGKPVANWWQGRFPEVDTGEDGFTGRAPVMSFQPNGYGIYDIAGNVWEWTADWYDDSYYAVSPLENPTGPKTGTERSMRGGSWLCSENFCSNYRVAGRSHSTPDTALNNLGFRCVRDWSGTQQRSR